MKFYAYNLHDRDVKHMFVVSLIGMGFVVGLWVVSVEWWPGWRMNENLPTLVPDVF